MVEQNLEELAPSMTSRIRGKLAEADKEFSWRKIEGGPKNESQVFERGYKAITQFYMSELGGKAVLDLFTNYKGAVSAFIRMCMQSEKITGEPLDAKLIGSDAEGPGEARLRPITAQTFDNFSYEQTPGATGRYNFIPDDTQADDSVETATDEEQAYIILGYAELTGADVAPYEYLQTDINDGIGTRHPFYTKTLLELTDSNIKILDDQYGPHPVGPSVELDIDYNIVTPNIKLRTIPLGVEVVRADSGRIATVF